MSSVRSGSRSGRRMKADINVVPYIDVMLVLLVIFMVTAPLITPGLIELPSVGQAADVPAQPLEVILTDVQHSGTQVKLVEELSNEDVHLQHICHILLLHVAQYINEPLKVPV